MFGQVRILMPGIGGDSRNQRSIIGVAGGDEGVASDDFRVPVRYEPVAESGQQLRFGRPQHPLQVDPPPVPG
jgi:hypothetical protein